MKRAALALLLFPLLTHADEPVLQRVLVEGTSGSQLGTADSASAGFATQQQLQNRIAYSPGELLEAAPGLVVTQHSGEGKANQYFLRGFNLDHGTDLRTTLDDMPVNQRSHAHGQGWTDLNFLIPELAARLDYRKGPYSGEDGDFASAGSALITYSNRLVQGVSSLTVGQNHYARALLANSPDVSFGVGNGTLLYALEVVRNDGPFVHPDDFKKLNGLLRYSQGYANNGFSVSLMAYRASWNASDQIPTRALDGSTPGTPLSGRFDTVDPSDGGATRRYSLSGVWRRTDGDSASRASAYLVRNQLELFSNFTYFMDDPVNGDQFAQPDRRVTGGVNFSYGWHLYGETRNTDITIGLQSQFDNIFNGLYSTRARQVRSTTRADHITEDSVGLFAESSTRWSDCLRSTAGIRIDDYRFGVRGQQAGATGNTASAGSTLASPSLNLVYAPWKNSEYYFNIGNGFHSNDARDAVSTEAQGGRTSGLARSHGVDVGLRGDWLPGLQTVVSLYRLDFDSELVYEGDTGATSPGRPSRRVGVELSNYYRPLPWLALDLDLAFARARYRDADPVGDHIPEAIEGVGQFGITINQRGAWSGALHLRYFGPRPLIEDNSVRSHASVTLNGRVAYRIERDLKLELEIFNMTQRQADAVAYYYPSRLAGEAAAVSDVHFHPLESRSLRLTLVKNF
jgi:outer membrane cobalamin receptor